MDRRYKSFFFIFFSILYCELVFKAIVFNEVLSLSVLNIFLFSLLIAFVVFLLTSFLKRSINKMLVFLFTLNICVIFSAQMLYYKTYGAIFGFVSMKQAGEVAEFKDAIFEIILNNLIFVILLFIPLILLILFHNKFSFKPAPKIAKVAIVIAGIITYFLAVICLHIGKNDIYSAYNLYYKEYVPVMMVEKLGLMTTMRIDLYYNTFGYEGEKYTYTKNGEEKSNKDEKEEITYAPNVLEIDFDDLMTKTTDEQVKNIHAYFKDVEPTYQNKYTGMFEGKNLILILAEALDPIAVDKKVTPTLYKLVHEGFNFTHFYTPLFPVSTSDGEYIQQTSLIPKSGDHSLRDYYQNDFRFTLAHLLLKQGYTTTAYHGHTGTYYNRFKSMPNLGYQNFYACKMGLKINCKQWPESDVEVIEASLPQYVNEDKFMTFYVSISGHLNYTRLGNMMVYKNWDSVKDLPYTDMVKGYMAAQSELDKSLKLLIDELEKAGKLEDTVIALSPDHYPYYLSLDEINEKASHKRDETFEKHRSLFILWNSEMETVKVDTLASNMDVLPTLANLFGLKYDSRLVMGRDILSKHEELVIFANRSWITEKGRYNSITKKYKGEEVDEDYIKRINKTVYNRFNISSLILEKDYYRYLRY